jgi:hypothetical protein
VLAERWRVHYNTVRPHFSLGYRPPAPEAWVAPDCDYQSTDRTSISVPSLVLVFGWFRCSQYAASRVLTGELPRRPFTERSVRTTLIVFQPPCLDQSFASASVPNQWAFRHSTRKVPLNDSTKALSVGLPGREKSIFIPFW